VLWESVEELGELLQARRINKPLVMEQLGVITAAAALVASQQEWAQAKASYMEAYLQASARCS
jgi:hypothetical protein